MTKTGNARLRRATLLAVLLVDLSAQAKCKLHTLTTHGSEARAGRSIVNLGEADDAIRPTAWQGPLVAGACGLEVGIIEGPLVMTSSDLLYVPTYSGSVRQLFLVDLRACSVRWKSTTFSGSLRIGPRALSMGGRRIGLDARCLPMTKN